jgi:hypothetical protein
LAILQFLFGGDPSLWQSDAKFADVFLFGIEEPENKHILIMVKYLYRFLYIMAKENKKIGLLIAQLGLGVFFKQVFSLKIC